MVQRALMIEYADQLHKCNLPIQKKRTISIGNSITDTITISSLQERILVQWDGESCIVNDIKLLQNKKMALDVETNTLIFYMIDFHNIQYYDISNKSNITIGSNPYNDIVISDLLIDLVLTQNKEMNRLEILKFNGKVFHNFKQIIGDEISLSPGDYLFFDGITLIIGEKDIQIIDQNDRVLSKLTKLTNMVSKYFDDYPNYQRSPRIIHREPEDRITIAKPTSKPNKPQEQLLRTILPPIIMIIALGIVSIFQPRGIYIFVILVSTVTMIIFSITQYTKNVKKYKAETKERKETYQTYLLNKSKELYQLIEKQKHALFYHYPNIEKIAEMIVEFNSRIYEKTMFHHDFLMYRVGIGNIKPSIYIDFNEEEFSKEKDELIDQAKELYNRFILVENVPIFTSLMKGPVGYIGQRTLVLEQLQLLVIQNAFFQSYHELQFVLIFPEEEKEDWMWMRWLPHAKLKELNIRGFVYHNKSRDQVLTSLYQIIKIRKQELEEKGDKGEKKYFKPHYIILITDVKIILDHIIMEFFNEDLSDIGVSLVFVQDVLPSLPEHVKTVIDIRDYKTGTVILEEGELINQEFFPDHFPDYFNKEMMARLLASINHLQNLKNSIPESVTFLEMYGYEKVEEFNLKENWRKNKTYKTLAVPLGLRAKDDIVYLNLHEKAHGPHGLIAGTTGSGKSEIIQSYILSLAVSFHPHEVAFLLIDYKGGGMANLFKNLPHLLGTITNLDGAQSMRALASIKAELQRRQRLFSENNVNHINQYQLLYKQGKVDEPLPHLFLISDEFAELKAEQPDFMKELVSTARIGRSLGIHLILATQKPSGVVDDQIWSNSKFKLALKVQNTSDSNEILKTPDAAEITIPGRAYLQVGNNEIYELFQSAWSGAEYKGEKNDSEVVDNTIYSINELGQYEILTKDLSGLSDKENIKKTKTELEAVVEHLNQFVEDSNIEKLPSPWLPPLKERIYIDELCQRNYLENWGKWDLPLEPIIGLGDFPEKQSQEKISISLDNGHVLVVSSPGYGKSTFLQTMVLDLARTHNPSRLHVYLLDFGTNGLLPLKGLPHVADTILIDANEKIAKLIRRLDKEIKIRKEKLSNYGVSSIKMYEKASGEKVANIVLIIDNYDSVRESDFVEPFESMMTQIAREGASIGIHLVISAVRQSALRTPLLSNIKTQIALYMIDQSDVRVMVGRTDQVIEELPGRGMIKLDEPALFQTALPTSGEDVLQIIETIQQEAKEMDNNWTGEKPKPIPMMPKEAIPFEQFKEMEETKQIIAENLLPLGLEFENVTPLSYDFKKKGNLVAIADRLERMEQLRMALAKNMTLLSHSYQMVIVDTPDKPLAAFSNMVNAYLSKPEELLAVKNEILNEIDSRLNENGHFNEWIILISNFKDFCTKSMLTDEEIEKIYNATQLGLYFIICSDYSYIGQSYESIPKYVRNQIVSGILSMRLSDQDIIRQKFISNEKTPEAYECYFAMEQHHIKLKVPK